MIPVYISIFVFALFPAPDETAYRKVVAALTSSTQKVWEAESRKEGLGLKYKAPAVSLFREKVVTACGTAVDTAYYCPNDSTLYIDRTFFAELDSTLVGGKAEFAQAYVFAWLTAKHVLNQTGHLQLVDQARRTRREFELSIRANLCASYLAGVWAHHAQKDYKFLNPKDAEVVIKTVRAVGDNRLVNRTKNSVQEVWNHGTAEQHVQFFLEGMKTGDASKARIDRFFTDRFEPRVIAS